jgi:hypothetical protein
MKKIALALMVLALTGCAELQVAADVLDILVPDDPCSKTEEATIEKATVNGVTVWRVSIPGKPPAYQFDELKARSLAASMETDFAFDCAYKRVEERSANQRKAREAIIEGKAKPQWESAK